MANPTTNYSFAMPTNTDLVKDLPADFEIFGQAVDTQMKTNADAAIAKTIVDAKGDLIVATAADTVSRLAVGGTNGQVLQVDSSTATGLKWDTVPAGGMTLLSTTTLSGASTTISNISQGYTHLDIFIDQFKPATDADTLLMRFNANATANRHKRWSTNSTLNGGGGTNNFDATDSSITGAVDNSVATNFVRLFIPYYTSTTVWRLANFWSVTVDSGVNTSFNSFNGVVVYNQTSAITSLLFKPESGNFTSGTVYIYGVK